jgi:ABC-type Fe3+/spermidine/putrescine transport system ATPase subunit
MNFPFLVGTTNLIKGVVRPEQAMLEVDGIGHVAVIVPKDKPWDGKEIFMSLRPEKIEISKKELPGFSNQLKGVVKSIVYHGRSTQYNVRLANDLLLQVFEQNEEHFPQEVIDYDDVVYLSWQKENVVLLER